MGFRPTVIDLMSHAGEAGAGLANTEFAITHIVSTKTIVRITLLPGKELAQTALP